MKSKNILIVLLLAVVCLKAGWIVGDVKSVSQIPTNVGNTSVPKTGNCHVAVDELGNVIVCYSLQGTDTRFVYKVMAPGETAFPSVPVQALSVIGVPLRLVNVDGQVKCFYYFVDGIHRNLYMSTWNSTMKVFENPVKIGFNVKGDALVEYYKAANGYEYVITDCNWKISSTTESGVVMKVNTGSGWSGDSVLVAPKGKQPKFISRNGVIEIYYLDKSDASVFKLTRNVFANNSLGSPSVLWNSHITGYELVTVNESLICSYSEIGIINFAKINNSFEQLPFEIQKNGPMQTFKSVFLSGKIHVVKSQGAGFSHWEVNSNCTVGEEVGSFSVTAENTGSLSAWTIQDQKIHTSFLVYDINRGTGFGANTYYNVFTNDPSDINNQPITAQTPQLAQNYPNPFNPSTTINYQLTMDNAVKLTVYNAKGELVKELVNTIQSAGTHSVVFDGANLNSGVYYYKLQTGNSSIVNKMVLCK